MKSKDRVHAVLEGKPVDRNPVTVLYSFLYHRDHFAELTGLPQWQYQAWLWSCPDEYLSIYRQMIDSAPLELLQPDDAPPRAERETVEFTEQDGRHFRRNKKTGELTPLADPVSGHAFDDRPHQTQYVFDRADVDRRVKAIKAEEQIALGRNDYIEAAIRAMGEEHFILSGGVIGTVYSCSWHVGLTNLFYMLVEKPNLIEYLCQKILEQNIEAIRRLAAAGGDAIYIDDATATSDMISVKHYERFSLPYMKLMVDEIHHLGHRAIVIYFGGVADRLDQIASIGADGLSVETSMKGYTNDIAEIARRIGQRVTLFGNVNPVDVLEQASDEELEAEVQRQAAAGRQARGFVMCTGSPITPNTPLARVRHFIEFGQRLR
jgi:uroporphyrinogen-III decarboxylase